VVSEGGGLELDWKLAVHRSNALERYLSNGHRSKHMERRAYTTAYRSVRVYLYRHGTLTAPIRVFGNVSMQYRFMMPEWYRYKRSPLQEAGLV
jgi:hypothetical protein